MTFALSSQHVPIEATTPLSLPLTRPPFRTLSYSDFQLFEHLRTEHIHNPCRFSANGPTHPFFLSRLRLLRMAARCLMRSFLILILITRPSLVRKVPF
jgi:hypothetical protein